MSKIALVDDHQLFLEGLSGVLAAMPERYDVVTYEDPLRLLDALEEDQDYALIICDLIMKKMNGLAFVGAMDPRWNIPVLIISGINTAPPITEMKQLGVQGFVAKSADSSILGDAVRTLLSGDSYWIAEADNAPATGFGEAEEWRSTRQDVLPVLTDRQYEILRLLGDGATNLEISEALSISPNTVKTHVKAIYDQFQVTKRTACIRAAQSFGML